MTFHSLFWTSVTAARFTKSCSPLARGENTRWAHDVWGLRFGVSSPPRECRASARCYQWGRLRSFDPEGESVYRAQTSSIPRTSARSVKLFLPCRGPNLSPTTPALPPLHNGNAVHIDVGYDCRCAIGGVSYYSLGSRCNVNILQHILLPKPNDCLI